MNQELPTAFDPLQLSAWADITRRRRQVFLVGQIGILVFAFVQFLIGTSFSSVLLVSGSACVANWLLAAAPFRLESWFAAMVFVQLIGFAWVFDSFALYRFDSGLLEPLHSLLLGSAGVLMAALPALLENILHPKDYLLARFYRNPSNWKRLGWALLGVGELSAYGGYFFGSTSLGSLAVGFLIPLAKFSIVGTALLANDALRKGRMINGPILLALGMGLVDGLLFNSKSSVLFRLGVYMLAILVGPVRRIKKWSMLMSGLAVLIVCNLLVFPLINGLRGTDFRSLPLSERAGMVMNGIANHEYTVEDFIVADQGDIWVENLHLIPSENWFLVRFASLSYIDLTLAFGDPKDTRMSFADFFRECIAEALPGPLSRNKDYSSLADRLWHGIDPRIGVGTFATMGSIASARLVFGEGYGLLFVALSWLIILWLIHRLYGSDIRTPLIQFIVITALAPMLEADIRDLMLSILRFIWQDVAILALAGWIFTGGVELLVPKREF